MEELHLGTGAIPVWLIHRRLRRTKAAAAAAATDADADDNDDIDDDVTCQVSFSARTNVHAYFCAYSTTQKALMAM